MGAHFHDIDFGKILYIQFLFSFQDGNEFYRFLPGDDPPAQIFNIPGVIVDVSFS